MGKPIIGYKKTEVYDEWVDEYEIFEHYYDLLVFLAVLGYHENEVVREGYRGSSKKGTHGEIGLQNVRSNDMYRSIMACLAYHHSSDPEALVREDLQMKTLAKYAAGGLNVVKEEFGDVSGDPTDAIISYLKDAESQDEDLGGELQEIVDAFDDEMMGASD